MKARLLFSILDGTDNFCAVSEDESQELTSVGLLSTGQHISLPLGKRKTRQTAEASQTQTQRLAHSDAILGASFRPSWRPQQYQMNLLLQRENLSPSKSGGYPIHSGSRTKKDKGKKGGSRRDDTLH
ncbi:hypothetical protein RRG08_060074 [Elysia crispata]|uniref:Uncharacterized protein n=1 Tax=Elysia crispata TaxID=231223 RepID=A0AAE0Y0H1_9GAST|nr:hypothetical protein RRG08_060074 [Elysia crispata]